MSSNELKVVNIRLVKEPSLYSTKPIRNIEDVIEVMAEELKQYDREVLCILNLHTDGKVINMNIVSIGTINSTLISPREVFKSSILSNASSIIILHNHPSGSTTPSREDKLVTERLFKCSQLLGIPLLDHIIIGGTIGDRLSMKQEGMFESMELSDSKGEYKNVKPRSR